MNEIGPQQLLQQIRSMNQALNAPQMPSQPGVAPTTTPSTTGTSFGTLLKSTLDGVNEAQQTSKVMKQAYVTGTSDASLAEVMIASEKADISFRAVTEVRNKLVQAYQDIMNMPV